MLCNGVLDIVVQLRILMQEMKGIRTKSLKAVIDNLISWDFVLVTGRDLFHRHQYLINPCDVFLDLSDIMLKHSQFNPLSGPQPLHNSGIFVPDVLFYNSLNSFNFIKSMVEPHNLTNQLGSFWNQGLVDILVHSVKSVPESLVDGGDPVELGVVRTHHCAIVADQLFTRVTEVSQRLFMKKAEFLSIEPRST